MTSWPIERDASVRAGAGGHMARPSHARPCTLRLQEGLAPPLERRSSSEPDLSSQDPHHHFWSSFGRGFPPGVTVDELARFRRRRPPCHLRPRDNLATLPAGALPSSEYRGQYVSHPQGAAPCRPGPLPDHLRLEGDQLVHQSEGRASYLPPRGARRAGLARRHTSLRCEGDMQLTSEQRDQHVAFPLPELTRPCGRQLACSLRLEGELERLTETRAQFVGHGSPERPALRRRPTSLHLDGDLQSLTESLDKYVAFREARRAELLRRPTSLRLEGDLEACPEYRDFFVDFPRARPVLTRPADTLKQEGDFEAMTEKRAQFVDFLLNYSARREAIKRPNNLRVEGDCSFMPEYRECFICFPRERPQVRKQPDNIRPEGDMDLSTEKQSRYVQHPGAHRPPLPNRATNTNCGGDASASGLHDNTGVEGSKGKGGSFLGADLRARRKPAVTSQPGDSSEIRPVQVARRARQADSHKPPRRYLPPRSGLLESERQLRETLEQERRRAPPHTSPGRAFRVIAARPDKNVTFDTASSLRGSSGAGDQEECRCNSPTFRLLVHPASVSSDQYEPSKPRTSPAHGSPSPAGKSFLVLDDVNNNDVSDCNGNLGVSARSRSARLAVPGRRARPAVHWMPPWYDAPSSI